MRILLIRLRLIGDVVFTTPAIAGLRARFPDAHLTYLVEAAAEPVVRHNPHLDEVLVVPRRRGVRRLADDLGLAVRLRRARFDAVIDFHGGPRAAWLTRATGARRRIGYAAPGRRWAYTDLVPWTRALVPPRHSVESQWALLAPLGIAGPPPIGQPPAEMAVDREADRRVAERLVQAGVSPGAELIVIHVSAGNPFRRWPADHFAALAANLAGAAGGRRIIISSGPSERDAADQVAERARAVAGPAGRRIIRCGEFDLLELRSLIGRAALYVGGDSGPLHVASTTGVPIVALFGPTLPERSMPWRDRTQRAVAVDVGALPCRPCHQRVCVPGDFRCLARIEPDRVLAAAEDLLVTARPETAPGSAERRT